MSRGKKLEAALEGLFSSSNEPEEATSPSEAPAPARPPVTEQVEEASQADEMTAAMTEERAAAAFFRSTPVASSPAEPGHADGQGDQLVVFTLDDHDYGVDIGTVNSIIGMQYITVVPHAPRSIKGVTNLRGTVLPVVDLRRRLGMSPKQEDTNTRIVVLEVRDTLVGITVDAVTEVLRVPAGGIEPPPPLVTTVESAFVTGIANVDSRLIILLDMDKVLSTKEQADR